MDRHVVLGLGGLAAAMAALWDYQRQPEDPTSWEWVKQTFDTRPEDPNFWAALKRAIS